MSRTQDKRFKYQRTIEKDNACLWERTLANQTLIHGNRDIRYSNKKKSTKLMPMVRFPIHTIEINLAFVKKHKETEN